MRPNKSLRLAKYLPCLEWAKSYDRETASHDSLAAVIVALMLIPQSLAYALLAGVPATAGLYASILPLVAYTLFGTSRTLSVGPVAVISLMTATALGPLFLPGSMEYAGAAIVLALLSGLLLLAMALLRLGFLANFLSHPVISGFISASALLIALSQLKHILGIDLQGENAVQLVLGLLHGLSQTHWPTFAIGSSSLIFLFLARRYLKQWLRRLGLPPHLADSLGRVAPILVLLVSILVVSAWELNNIGVRVVGTVPQGLPELTLPAFDLTFIQQLLPAALLISLVGFVESVSVGQTLAARFRERIEPNQELVALGSANIAAAFSGGIPVTGGFSRSVVNFDAGARTPMAGTLAAIGIAITALYLTPFLYHLPHAVLGATIIVAVLGLVDLGMLTRTWRYSRQDGAALLAAMLGVLLIGVEAGILLGGGLSLLLFLWRTSQPHIAVVGQVPGSEHFRNVDRHSVTESPKVLSVRVDESLYFPNARYLEDRIAELVERHPGVEHLVLMCSGINHIDASALESLETICERLHTAGIQLHLSEVKGPVMDRLQNSDFLQQFGGQVFLSQFEALKSLDPDSTCPHPPRPSTPSEGDCPHEKRS